MAFSGVQCFFYFACRVAACLSADKNPGIKPAVEDEWVPQPLSPISGKHRREKRPGKHVGELSLLPSSVTGRIKAEKVCGEDKREGWLADMEKNKTCWKKGSRVKHYWFYNRYFQSDVGAFGLLTNFTVTEPKKSLKIAVLSMTKSLAEKMISAPGWKPLSSNGSERAQMRGKDAKLLNTLHKLDFNSKDMQKDISDCRVRALNQQKD